MFDYFDPLSSIRLMTTCTLMYNVGKPQHEYLTTLATKQISWNLQLRSLVVKYHPSTGLIQCDSCFEAIALKKFKSHQKQCESFEGNYCHVCWARHVDRGYHLKYGCPLIKIKHFNKGCNNRNYIQYNCEAKYRFQRQNGDLFHSNDCTFYCTICDQDFSHTMIQEHIKLHSNL